MFCLKKNNNLHFETCFQKFEFLGTQNDIVV